MEVPNLGLPLVDNGDPRDDDGWDLSIVVNGAFQFNGNGGQYVARTAREELDTTEVFYVLTVHSISFGDVKVRAGGVSGPAITTVGTHYGTITPANGDLVGIIETHVDGTDARCGFLQIWQIIE